MRRRLSWGDLRHASPAQNLDVVRWLRQNSGRPLVAHDLWATLFLHLNRQKRQKPLKVPPIALIRTRHRTARAGRQ